MRSGDGEGRVEGQGGRRGEQELVGRDCWAQEKTGDAGVRVG